MVAGALFGRMHKDAFTDRDRVELHRNTFAFGGISGPLRFLAHREIERSMHAPPFLTAAVAY